MSDMVYHDRPINGFVAVLHGFSSLQIQDKWLPWKQE
jgi:hypothetical protein